LLKRTLGLLALTLGTFFVHGYHPWAEDAEIYLPGVERILNPRLFPHFPEFFQSHAHLTFFPDLLAGFTRIVPLPWEWILFWWQFAAVFLLLLACWELGECCFHNASARWAGVTLVAALLTLPIAGTALYVMDQYINPRNLAAFCGVFAVARTLQRKYVQASCFVIGAAVVHPLMAVFSTSFCVLLILLRKTNFAIVGCVLLLFGFSVSPPSEGYHQAALLHSFHYLTRWQWYEWVGALAPLAILWAFRNVALRKGNATLELVCRALAIYGAIYFGLGLVLSIPARFESLARIQPMRSLHLLYIIFILLAGGLIGEFALQTRIWRWAAMLIPLCLGMFAAQRALFPQSAHIEWPGIQSKNAWVEAFEWTRRNTPIDAVFAMDPYYMAIPGEDHNGFRAVAHRSRIADTIKDSGAVSMFPALADEWFTQTQDLKNWKDFQLQNLQALQQKYGVNWVVLQAPGISALQCPFRNYAVMVCPLNE